MNETGARSSNACAWAPGTNKKAKIRTIAEVEVTAVTTAAEWVATQSEQCDGAFPDDSDAEG